MDILIDTIKDTILIIPILFLMYLCLEYFEHKTLKKDYSTYLYKYGPLFASFVGVIPQCGFSVLASLLFIEKKITLGTLISVFIATSDEAIPILITNPDFYPSMFALIIIKLIIAIVIGYIVDILFQRQMYQGKTHIKIDNHQHSLVYEALVRTMKIYIVIFMINVILSFIIELIGTDQLSYILLNNSMVQPVIAALFGFIPNCSASIIMSQLFMNQSLSLASLLAGLISNAGLGILVLVQNKVRPSMIFRICMILFISSLIIGLPLQWFYLH